jgi:hypothetical protein
VQEVSGTTTLKCIFIVTGFACNILFEYYSANEAFHFHGETSY